MELPEKLTAELIEVLIECEDYFDQRSDADHDDSGFFPNAEMRLLSHIREVLNPLERLQSL